MIYLNICSLKGIPGLKLRKWISLSCHCAGVGGVEETFLMLEKYNEAKNSIFAGLELYLNFKSCTHIRRGCYDCYHK